MQERRLKKTNTIPCRCIQDQFKKAIQAQCRVNLPAIAVQLGLRLSTAADLYQHFRECSMTNGGNRDFAYFGEMEWKRVRYCATCGTPTRHTINGECRSCFLGPIPVDHWKALELVKLDAHAPMSPERCACREALADVAAEVAKRLAAEETIVTPERMSDLSDLLTDCFSDEI